jgi:hypothetical protein
MSRESPGQAGSPEGEVEDDLERALARWGRPGPGGLPDLDGLRASLDLALAEERGLGAFLRSRGTPLRLVAVGLTLAAAAVAMGLGAGRLDMASYPLWRLWLGLSVMAVCFVVSVGLALWPLSRRAPAPRLVTSVLVLAPLLLSGLYLLPASHDHAASLPLTGEPGVLARALPCFGWGLIMALIAVAVLRLFDRGGSRAALLLASASGLAANLLLLLHCSVSEPQHMLIGHLGVLLVVLAGARLMQGARR